MLHVIIDGKRHIVPREIEAQGHKAVEDFMASKAKKVKTTKAAPKPLAIEDTNNASE